MNPNRVGDEGRSLGLEVLLLKEPALPLLVSSIYLS
jgi:hypothetical protein